MNAVAREIARGALLKKSPAAAAAFKWEPRLLGYPHPYLQSKSLLGGVLAAFVFAALMFGFVTQVRACCCVGLGLGWGASGGSSSSTAQHSSSTAQQKQKQKQQKQKQQQHTTAAHNESSSSSSSSSSTQEQPGFFLCRSGVFPFTPNPSTPDPTPDPINPHPPLDHQPGG